MFNRTDILIVDDHEAIRSGIRTLLESRPGWHVCGEAVDGVDAVEKVRALHPDLVLMDISMPRMDGITAMGIVQREAPDSRVIIVTQNDANSLRRESANADGYVLKVHLHRDLLPTIERVLGSGHDGGEPMTASVPLLQSATAAVPPPAPERTLQPQSTDLLAAIIASSDDAVIGNDPNGIVISWNEGAHRIFGFTADDMIGTSIMRTIPSDRQNEAHELMARIQRGERAPPCETVRVRDDGTPVDVSITISPLRDPRGRIIGASTIARELERRNAETHEQSRQLQELSSRLQRDQDGERRRIARSLHDSAGQLLAVLGLNLGQMRARVTDAETGRAIEHSEQIVDQLSSEIRTMSYLLHPPLLDESGLARAIHWYVRGLEERGGFEISLDIPDDFGRLPSDMELAVFRIVQECLTNIRRHSGSRTATIRLRRDDGRAYLEVMDEGHGIPEETLAHLHRHRAGVGIAGMRERVRHFGGEMRIDSSERGTTVSAILPVPTQS